MSQSGKESLTCPKCSAKVVASSEYAGRRVRCPKCENTIKVPGVRKSESDDDDWLSLDEPVAPVAAPLTSSHSKPKAPTSSTGGLDSNLPDSSELLGDDDGVNSQPEEDSDTFALKLPLAKKKNDESAWLDQVADSGSFEGFDSLPDFNGDTAPTNSFPLTDSTEDYKAPSKTPTVPDPTANEVVSEDTVQGEYRFNCPVCDSAHYAKAGKAGRQIKCADCHSTIVVPAPPKIRPKYNPSLEKAEVFGLKESVVRSNSPESPFTKSAEQLLREAEDTHIDDELEEMYENPDVAGWFKNTFGVFIEPIVWLNLGISTAVLTTCCAIGLSLPEALHQAIGATVLCAAGGLFLGSCCIAILSSTSKNEETVAHWPIAAPFAWLGDATIVVAACFLCALPGVLFGALIPPLLLVLLFTSLFATLPIVLLSMLENRSIFSVYSSEVIKSLTRCKEQWGAYYFSSGLCFLGLFFVVLNSGIFPSAISKGFLIGGGISACGFVIARLLGRIAYENGQVIETYRDRQQKDAAPPVQNTKGRPQ